MKVCRVKVRIEPEQTYWERQAERLQDVEKALQAGRRPRVRGTELVFASLADMARALTPNRIEVLRLIRRHQPSSVRQLAVLARREFKNVLADVKALKTLGLIETGEARSPRHRKAPRTGFGRIEVQVEL
jgi:predicted transcriptional regulator